MNLDKTTYRYINNYIEVFSCLFMHDYYIDRICNELVIQPTPATSALMKNYQLIFKSTLGGFALAANNSKDYRPDVFKDSFDLNFEFRFTNPYFFSFTALNLDPEARYFVDDDLRSSVLFLPEMQTDNPELDRPGISGILRIKHLSDYSVLPFVGTDSSNFIPRSKIVYIKPREIKLVYICYASDDNIDHFQGLTIEIEGVFDGLVSFGEPERIETLSGFPAFKFTTETQIPMKGSWKGVFRLERNNQLGYYRKSLPNPSPKSIKYDFTINNYISENYVKL